MQRPESQLKNIETLSLAFAKLKSNLYVQWFLLFSIILLAIVPKTMINGHYIYPDLYFKYPAWFDFINKMPKFSPLKSDFVDGFYYYKDIYEGIANGELRLWNPFVGFGRPLSSIFFLGHFFPIHTIMATFSSPIEVFTYAIIFKMYIGSLGMLLWIKDITRSRPTALLVAALFPLSGHTIVWLLGGAASIALWMPWIFLALKKLADSKNDIKSTATWSVTLALVLSGSGFLSGVGYTLYFSGLFLAFYLLKLFFEKKEFTFLIYKSLAYFTGVVLGLGIMWFSFAPALELMDWIDISYRSSNAMGHLNTKSLQQFLLPLSKGSINYLGYRGEMNYNEACLYIGSFATLFMPLGIIYSIRNRSFFWPSVLGGLFVLCGMIIFNTADILNIVSKLPVFSTSMSTRIVSVAAFLAFSLAGFGFKGLLDTMESKTSSKLIYGLVPLFGFAALAVAYNWSPLSYSYKPLNFEELKNFNLDIVFLLSVGLSLVFLISKRQTTLFIFAFILAGGELIHYAEKQIPTIERQEFYPPTPGTDFLQNNLKPWERTLATDSIFAISPTERVYGINSAIGHRLHTPLEKQLVNKLIGSSSWGSYTAPLPKSGKLNLNNGLTNLFGIKYVITSPNVKTLDHPDYKQVFRKAGHMSIFENTKYRGVAQLVNQFELVSKPKVAEALSSPSFDPSKTVIVEKAPGSFSNTSTTDINKVEVLQYDYDVVSFKTDSPNESILATSEVYYPGWIATINGKNADILKVNGLFRGLVLPAGENVVEFKYKPDSFFGNLKYSLLAVFTILALLVWGYRREKAI